MEENEEELNYEYASFWKRAGAFAIDALIIGVALRILFPRFQGKLPKFSHRVNWLFDLAVSFPGLLNLIAEGAYLILMWTKTGQTVGQKAMGIKVIKKNGEPLTYTDSIVRYIGYIISGSLVGFGFFWMLIDEQKQGIHDKMAGTIVVKCEKETEENAVEEV